MGFDLTGLGSVADAAKTIANKFLPDKMGDADRAKMELELQGILSAREQAVIDTQKSVMVAELQQEDRFTKRVRPAILYSGLLFIFLVHVFLPILAFFLKMPMPQVALPESFWGAWSGVCSIYVVGRSVEKLGIGGKITGLIAGK
jgi:hypothetical protein